MTEELIKTVMQHFTNASYALTIACGVLGSKKYFRPLTSCRRKLDSLRCEFINLTEQMEVYCEPEEREPLILDEQMTFAVEEIDALKKLVSSVTFSDVRSEARFIVGLSEVWDKANYIHYHALAHLRAKARRS